MKENKIDSIRYCCERVLAAGIDESRDSPRKSRVELLSVRSIRYRLLESVNSDDL